MKWNLLSSKSSPIYTTGKHTSQVESTGASSQRSFHRVRGLGHLAWYALGRKEHDWDVRLDIQWAARRGPDFPWNCPAPAWL